MLWTPDLGAGLETKFQAAREWVPWKDVSLRTTTILWADYSLTHSLNKYLSITCVPGTLPMHFLICSQNPNEIGAVISTLQVRVRRPSLFWDAQLGSDRTRTGLRSVWSSAHLLTSAHSGVQSGENYLWDGSVHRASRCCPVKYITTVQC